MKEEYRMPTMSKNSLSPTPREAGRKALLIWSLVVAETDLKGSSNR
jgi:hypothetical protein